MGMRYLVSYLIDIIADTNIKTDVIQKKLSAPENTLCSELGNVTHSLFGENSLTPAARPGSTVLYSGMKADINHQTLSDRLTPLLISAGLVRGIIPMLMRKKSNQLTLDIVLKPLDGDNAEKQEKD